MITVYTLYAVFFSWCPQGGAVGQLSFTAHTEKAGAEVLLPCDLNTLEVAVSMLHKSSAASAQSTPVIYH